MTESMRACAARDARFGVGGASAFLVSTSARMTDGTIGIEPVAAAMEIALSRAARQTRHLRETRRRFPRETLSDGDGPLRPRRVAPPAIERTFREPRSTCE
jgi:hypothetical protein